MAFEIDEEIRQLIDRGTRASQRGRHLPTSTNLEAIADLLVREETIEGEELEALFDSPRPKPDLVGPPAASPAASMITPAEEKKPRSKRSDSDDRDRPPIGGTMRAATGGIVARDNTAIRTRKPRSNTGPGFRHSMLVEAGGLEPPTSTVRL